MKSPPDLSLAADFPTPSLEQWRALVAKVLARSGVEAPEGAPEGALASVTAEDITIAPLYTGADATAAAGFPGQAPFTRGRTPDGIRGGWDNRVSHAGPEPKEANSELLADLAGGATSVWLQLQPDGLTPADLPAVLDEVYFDLVAVSLEAGPRTGEAAAAFLDLAATRGVAAEALTGCLGADPLGAAARSGSHDSAPTGLAEAADLAARCAGSHPGLVAVCADALPYHEAGASDAEELGCALATGVAYLQALTAGGLTVDQALGQLEFRLAVTADQFAAIAKLRAARRAWARVAEVCGASAAAGGQRQHAVTSWPMLTVADPWNNMLRATLACFGACAGGADAITVLPFDAAIGRSDALARRIARNTPELLVEESHVAVVTDPAGGSWFVESLTEALAAAAWQVFVEIEAAGGLPAALPVVTERIAATRAARIAAITDGRETLVGVNRFPAPDRASLRRPPLPEVAVTGGLPRIRWEQACEGARNV